MRHTHKGVVLLLLCVAQFMVVLDVAIVNVALPSIQQDLGVGRSTLQWIVIAYGLTLGGFHAAFWVVFAIAVSGAVMAAIAFPRPTTTRIELDPAPSHAPIVPEPTNASVAVEQLAEGGSGGHVRVVEPLAAPCKSR